MTAQGIHRIIGPGLVVNGSGINLNEAIEVARERFPGRSFCVVADWYWIDLEAPKQVIDELKAEGKQAVMLVAFDVLFSSSGAQRPGEWLRTTPLLEFSDDMFFQTENTVYVLIGNGRRNTSSLSTVLRLFSSYRNGY